MRLIILSALVLLAPAPAAAQSSPDSGPEVAVRLGFGLPFGEIESGTNLDRYASSVVPIVFEGGYRLDSSLFLGALFQYGFAQMKNPNGTCDGGTSCDGSVVRLGAEALYRFVPERIFAPWLGLGFGYEWLTANYTAANAAVSGSFTGYQFLILQAGGDYRVREKMFIGPFVDVSLGRFDHASGTVRVGNINTSSDRDIANTAWHTWVTFGLRGAFGF
jgi:hypothetical protein